MTVTTDHLPPSKSPPTPRQNRRFSALPVIDISGLYAEQEQKRIRVAAELAEAAENVGFFYITGYDIPPALESALIDCAKEYFGQSLPEKMCNYIGHSQNHSGYVPEGEERFYASAKQPDLKETYDVNYDLTDLTLCRPMLGPGQWPDNKSFKSTVSAYYHAGLDLGRVLFRGFALALGLDEEYFDSVLRHPPNQLRLIHYPCNSELEDREGIGAHTDYECFTLLLPTEDGLEVMNGAGEWIDAPVRPGCLIVNIGDMMEVLSNGRFVATTHRVRQVPKERYSFPLFCTCDYDTIIQPVVPAATSHSGKKYQPIRCGDHLYAQTIQTFSYLQQRLAEGKINLPDSSLDLASFGRDSSLSRGVEHP